MTESQFSADDDEIPSLDNDVDCEPPISCKKFLVYCPLNNLLGHFYMEWGDENIPLLDMMIYHCLQLNKFVCKSILWDFVTIDNSNDDEIVFWHNIEKKVLVKVVAE